MKHKSKSRSEFNPLPYYKGRKRVSFTDSISQEKEEMEQYKTLKLSANKQGLIKEDMPILYLSNRTKAIDHIKHLCKVNNFSDNAFFASVYYLDIVMSKYTPLLTLKKIHLFAVCCLIIAYKFIQNDITNMRLTEIADLSSDSEFKYSFTKQELRHCEIECVKLLEYDLGVVTVFDLVKAMIHKGVLFKDEINEDSSFPMEFYRFAKALCYSIVSSFELTWLTTQDMLSMCVIELSRKYFKLKKRRMKELKKQFGCVFDEDDYKDCYYKLKRNNSNSDSSQKENDASIIANGSSSITIKNPLPTQRIIVKSIKQYKSHKLVSEHLPFITVTEPNEVDYNPIPLITKPKAKGSRKGGVLKHLSCILKDKDEAANSTNINTTVSTTNTTNVANTSRHDSCFTLSNLNLNNPLMYSASSGLKKKKKAYFCLQKHSDNNNRDKLPLITSHVITSTRDLIAI